MKINKEFLYRNLSRIPRFFNQWYLYGFKVAFWCLVFPFKRLFGNLQPYFCIQKHKSILLYLYKKYSNLIDNLSRDNDIPETLIDPKSPIWVCWWDGEESMPDLVKICYNTIRKNAENHTVQLITKNNFYDFISIPDYILEKVNSGVMTVTHFSNIIRVNLLYNYGGIWMDATILVLQNIFLKNLSFFTLKAPAKNSDSVTLSRYAGLSDLSVSYKYQNIPEISRWSGFLLAGTKNSLIFKYLRDILYAYWKDHNDQIDYLLFDYTIALGYDNFPVIKKMIDNVPCSPTEKFILEKNMNNEYSDKEFSQYYSTPFHKLTWKLKFDFYTKENRATIYSHILNF